MTATPGRFEVLRLRDFRYLFVGMTISAVGNVFTTVALALGVLAATGSVTAVGLVVAARQGAMMAFVLVGGAWADRVSRRTLMTASYAGAAVTQGMMAALLLSDTGTTWNLASVAFVNGAVLAVLGPTATSLLPQVVPPRLLQQGNALFSLTRNSANIAGAVVAGLLVAATEPGWALVVDAGTFAVGAWLVARLPAGRPATARVGLLAELREGWREFRSRTWVWAIVLQFTLVYTAYAAGLEVYAPVVAKNDLGGPHAFGLIVGAFGVGAVCGGLLMLRLAPSRPLIAATVGIAVSIPTFATLAAGFPLAVVMAAALVGGVGIETFSVLWASALQEHVPDDVLARVSAYDYLGSMALAPVGLAVAGPVAVGLGGVHAGLWVVVIAMVVPTALVLLVPDLWRLRRTTAAP